MTEQFKDIPGYEGYYEVSNFGNVKSLERIILRSDGQLRRFRERYLKLNLNNNNYYNVCLSVHSKTSNIPVHQLMAMAWLGHEPNGHEGNIVIHKDGVTTNNIISNLELKKSKGGTRKGYNFKKTLV